MAAAVRVAAADFRKPDGKIDTDKLATAIGAGAEKALAAKIRSSQWDTSTGELMLELTRADETVAGLPLTELLRASGALVAPEKSGKSDNLIIWIGDVATETVDSGPEPHLKFTGATTEPEEDAEENESDEVAARFVEDLKGKGWNVGGSAWK